MWHEQHRLPLHTHHSWHEGGERKDWLVQLAKQSTLSECKPEQARYIGIIEKHLKMDMQPRADLNFKKMKLWMVARKQNPLNFPKRGGGWK